MKVIENTPDELILRERSIVWGVVLCLISILILSLGFAQRAQSDGGSGWFEFAQAAFWALGAYIFSYSTNLSFHGPAGSLNISVRRVIGVWRKSVPLKSVSSAEIVWDDGSAFLHLQRSDGQPAVKLRESLHNFPKSANVLQDTINQWLRDNVYQDVVSNEKAGVESATATS